MKQQSTLRSEEKFLGSPEKNQPSGRERPLIHILFLKFYQLHP